MFRFAPSLLLAGDVIELPRPVRVCRLQDQWDFLKLKVPMKDGNELTGVSRNGVEISLEGELGSHSGELTITEASMWETMLTLRESLQVGSDEKFLFSLFESDEGENFRYFRECTPSRFEMDLSSKRIFTYRLSLHAADPRLYEGNPYEEMPFG